MNGVLLAKVISIVSLNILIFQDIFSHDLELKEYLVNKSLWIDAKKYTV